MIYILLIAGFVFLILGAELLVRGSARMAAVMGIPPLAIGLTVVAFGTSAPELMVSVQAALSGQADIAVANVVGSNILNILFVLGVSAIITPLVVHMKLIFKDVPIMIGISFLMWVLSLDGNLGVVDGVILFGGIVGYIFFALKQEKEEDVSVKKEYEEEFHLSPRTSNRFREIVRNLVFVVMGLAALILGAKWLITGAVHIAKMFGVSELVIGLTLVALGTSLPEVATSIMAAVKGERDIAIGNAIGSNIFNILCILGVTSIASGGRLPVSSQMLHFDMPFMILVAISCWPVFVSGRRVSRMEGALFVGAYVLYTVFLFYRSAGGGA